MPDRAVKLGETLSALIDRGGYSRNRHEILQAVGISAAALSQYTRDQTRPSFQKLLALADFFNVSVDYLIYGEIEQHAGSDPTAVVRHAEQALADVQTRSSRHSELVGRIGRVLADRIDDVAREFAASASAGWEGLIQDEESVRIERFCLQADILTLTLDHDLMDMPGDHAAAVHFLEVVAGNLQRGCEYRFLVPFGSEDALDRLRMKLTDRVGRDSVRRNCAFRRTGQPVVAGVALYRLDLEEMRTGEAALLEQMRGYISDEGDLGYVIRANADSGSDMIMHKGYRERARQAFESLWTAALRV